MTIEDLLSRIRISEVWIQLGGRPPRNRRAPAFWRETKDPNIALNDVSNTWYDHARSQGGGVLDLIEHVRNCQRKEAVNWLAGFLGVSLDDNRKQWRAMTDRRNPAEAEAEAFLHWKRGLVETLREYRTVNFRAYHRAKNYILRNGLDGSSGELAAEVAEVSEGRYQTLDSTIDKLIGTPYRTLLPYFRKRNLA